MNYSIVETYYLGQLACCFTSVETWFDIVSPQVSIALTSAAQAPQCVAGWGAP